MISTIADGPRPRLMTIESDYSLHVIRTRKLEHEVFSRNAGGWFEKVWHVNPLTGADPTEPHASSYGAPTVTELREGHTFIEGHVGLTSRLRLLGPINFLLAQIHLFLRINSILRRERVSLIRVGDPYYLGLFGLLLARLHHVPLVVKIAGNYDAIYAATGTPMYPRLLRSRRVEKAIERAVLRQAGLVAAANENNLAFALANGASKERTTIFRYGSWIDPRHFEPVTERSDVLATLGVKGTNSLVLVSRLEPSKHPEDAIKALSTVKEKVPDAVLVLVGEGSMRDDLRALADRLGIADSVVFAGARDQDEVRGALRDAGVILAPLAGRALVEAALSARPVVAYDVEWHSELIDDDSGILVPYRDAAELGRAAARLMLKPTLADRLGARARERCLEMMDPVALVRHEQSEYRRLLERTTA